MHCIRTSCIGFLFLYIQLNHIIILHKFTDFVFILLVNLCLAYNFRVSSAGPLYRILYNTVLKLNMPKWTAHMVATLFSLGSADQAFVNFLYNTQQKVATRRPFYYSLLPYNSLFPAILIHM